MNAQENDLFGQFARLTWLMHIYHQNVHRRHGPMGDPYRGQGRILALLKLRPEISQKDLSYLLDMRPQSLGEFLAKLERSGYITRTPSETDRRVMDIRLTEKGAEAAEQRTDLDGLFESLTADERHTLSEYLGRLIASLEQQLDGEEGRPGFNWRGGPRGMGRLAGVGRGCCNC